MTDHAGLPVAGYQPQSADKIAIINRAKELEERVLRHLDELICPSNGDSGTMMPNAMLLIARERIIEGFMWANRAVFQPGRVNLQEDAT